MNQQCYFKLNTLYSITLNPSDKYQFHNTPYLLRYKKFRNYLYEQLLPITCKYTIYIELSEPHQNITSGNIGPRLHAHGLLEFTKKKQLTKFLLSDMYRLLRTMYVDIDTVESLPIWLKYCTKQQLLPHPIITNFTE